MKNDIATPEVTDVAVAVVPRREPSEDLWDIYLVNRGNESLENILITSQGYGMIDGVDKTTTVLRHFHQTLCGNQSIRIEPIQPSLFNINNEYWVSFNRGGHMLDKRFVFKAGSIKPDALEHLPEIGRQGVIMQ